MKNTCLLIAILFISVSAIAQPQIPHDYEALSKVADQYFEAYSSLDAKAMITFYHDDINYIDETYIDNKGETADLKGKKEIEEAFTQFFPIAKKFTFDEKERFFSGNQGVFRGVITVHYKGSVAGADDSKTLVWSTNYTMVLTFKDGKIIRQNDFVNYTGAKQEWQ